MKVVSSKEVFSTPIFRVTEDHAVAPDGFEIQRAIVRHHGTAVMLPVDEKGRVLLVRQYRLPARARLWELPAGRLDEGESPLQAARRELREETGYRARKWRKLISYYLSPGFIAVKVTVYLATGLTPGEAQPMDDERIEVRWFTPQHVDEWIRKGRITDGKTILAFRTWEREKD